eukprot:TRINITY_DN24019_c0_g1_i1.p1 TRINITY_DN24019_c0_g1~~TRINITY_DN24019_c0_g1_i1.p1  ORF type:complete len:131 (-),score=63.66 TRINITY_DN24019_c0_g1_i1:51-443(-)
MSENQASLKRREHDEQETISADKKAKQEESEENYGPAIPQQKEIISETPEETTKQETSSPSAAATSSAPQTKETSSAQTTKPNDEYRKITRGKLSLKSKRTTTKEKEEKISETEKLDKRCKEKRDRHCNY